MPRRFRSLAVSLTVLSMLSGCVQATRHSNTMVFGTNTSFGVKVGTSATQVPSVIMGYDRQEAVIMPLVANAGDNGTFQKPCDFSRLPSLSSDVTYRVHPCSLVAYKGDAQDSYSVLASFGAKFEGSGGTSNSVKGGLAQYFATGMAAQILALTGGAAVVAVGEAAEEAAQNAPEAAKAIPSLFGKPFGEGKMFERGKSYASFESALKAKIGPAAGAGQLAAKIASFETAAGISTGMRTSCTNADVCIKQLSDNDEYYDLFGDAATAKKCRLHFITLGKEKNAMGNVTIKCFKSADEAFDDANFAKGAGRKVAVAGPTEIVKVKGNAPDEIKWESGPNFDWYVVISTVDDLVMP